MKAMTSGFKVWWQLTKERGRQAIQLLWVDLGVVAVLVVMRLLGRLTAADLLGFSIMFGMLTALVAFIAEAQGQEQVWVTNRWRLVPVAEWKLSGASVLANAATSLGLWAVLSIVSFGLALVDPAQDIHWGLPGPYVLPLAVLILMLALLVWAIISLAHMLSLMITDFLPGMQEKWLKRLLTFVIILVAIKLVDWFFAGLTWLFKLTGIPSAAFSYSGTVGGTFHGAVTGDLWLAIATFAVGVLILSLVNMYLLSHWVETKQVQAAG
ncbi:hypothetical protein FC75_GL000229 [Lacticaseibacillus camelliae DSM 22697 = JCM 13995]|uniref:Uncharacterized protein n=1 Tax=Lacticaseibacillus camelliae DSM 22697 = JCM 13995 TaxID=1423730 RepID=A0A0R2F1Z7_9LACO|nr:hypothetical protein FC75_GL000229 [Lacticaseibacillus camelliae DSM 22697 = JCM 13995]